MYHIVAIDYQDRRIIDIPYYKVGFRDQHYEVFLGVRLDVGTLSVE